jgi:hypothetical protein
MASVIMLRLLIIYNNIEVLKDFTDLLKKKEFVLQCISINGATLVSALEYNPDLIIVEREPDVKSEAFLKRLLSKKFLFKASVHLYSRSTNPIPNLPGIKLLNKVEDLIANL